MSTLALSFPFSLSKNRWNNAVKIDFFLSIEYSTVIINIINATRLLRWLTQCRIRDRSMSTPKKLFIGPSKFATVFITGFTVEASGATFAYSLTISLSLSRSLSFSLLRTFSYRFLPSSLFLNLSSLLYARTKTFLEIGSDRQNFLISFEIERLMRE